MIGITGATGQLGGRVARLLAADGIPLRLVVREPARAPQLDEATVAAATYDDRDASRRALEGVETLFMVSAAEHADRVNHHRAFIDAAAGAGVQHVVYTSFINAAPDATFTLARDHWATEQHLQGSGLRWTLLRDNLYADFFPMLAGADGVIRGPAGDGRVAAVAQDDIADVAAAVLRDPGGHLGRSYDLTGPEALTLYEVAATLTETTRRPYRYDPETLEEAYATRASYGVPAWQVDAWVSTYTAIAAGDLAEVRGDVGAISGHPPTSLVELLQRSSRT